MYLLVSELEHTDCFRKMDNQRGLQNRSPLEHLEVGCSTDHELVSGWTSAELKTQSTPQWKNAVHQTNQIGSGLEQAVVWDWFWTWTSSSPEQALALGLVHEDLTCSRLSAGVPLQWEVSLPL